MDVVSARIGGVVQGSRPLVNARREMRVAGSNDFIGGERVNRDWYALRP